MSNPYTVETLLETNTSTNRYYLHRMIHQPSDPLTPWARLGVVMLNPSTADQEDDDPTIRRLLAYALRWGMHELHVANLYTMRTSDPGELVEATKAGVTWVHGSVAAFAPLDLIARRCGQGPNRLVCAWGTNVERITGGWVNTALRTLGRDPDTKLWHLGDLTDGGHPRHPLYQRNDAELQRYVPAQASAHPLRDAR